MEKFSDSVPFEDIKREYQSALKVEAEQLLISTNKRINRWSNFQLWLEARILEAIAKPDTEEKEQLEIVRRREKVRLVTQYQKEIKKKVKAIRLEKIQIEKWLLEAKSIVLSDSSVDSSSENSSS